MDGGVWLRRVGFRTGTDEELSALHAVEVPIEVERRPGREPQPLESYIAFARNLPSQFDDHTWLVEAGDGTPIGSGACWSNAFSNAPMLAINDALGFKVTATEVNWQANAEDVLRRLT